MHIPFWVYHGQSQKTDWKYNDILNYSVQLIETKDWELNNMKEIYFLLILRTTLALQELHREQSKLSESNKYTKFSWDWFGYKIKILKELETRYKSFISIIRTAINLNLLCNPDTHNKIAIRFK